MNLKEACVTVDYWVESLREKHMENKINDAIGSENFPKRFVASADGDLRLEFAKRRVVRERRS